jgi:spoIIIJ-associated protein
MTDDAFGADDNSSARIDAESAPDDGAQHDGKLIASDDADAADADTADADADAQPGDLLEREGEVAADYLEGLLDIIDVDGDIDMDVEGNRAVVSVIGDHLRQLVGAHGSVLDALQDLTRLAVAQETGERSRLMLDIAGHRAKRRAELTALATRAAEQASTSGEPVTLEPMTAFERKVVHDAVAAAGQLSESEGEEPNRRVVVLPARARSAADTDSRAATQPHEPVADQA